MKTFIKKVTAGFTTFAFIFSLTVVQQPVFASNKQIFYTVTKVIDGDTIQVKIGSKKEKVRLIGIDTPEIVDPRKTVQCFGKEASQKAKNLMLGKKVRLESDTTNSNRDKYNRLLRYVYLQDGTSVNEVMIKEGYAFTYVQFPFQYMPKFKQYQSEAKSSNKGLWDANTCPQKTTVLNEKKENCVIKGNINSSGDKIFHIPNGAYYDKTTIDQSAGEKWFCSEADAIDAGWRKSIR